MIKFEDVKDISTEQYFSGDNYAVDMFNAKYPHVKEDGIKETPAEVFQRVAKELASMETNEKTASKLAEIWFSLMFEGWFRPGGSIMAGIGSGKKASLANCFSRDTRFITNKGIKSFEDFEDNDEVQVLTRYGGFNNAIVKYHGNQKLFRLALSRHNTIKEIFCTEDHLWPVLDKKDCRIDKETASLIPGDIIPYIKRKWSLSKSGERYFCPIGFIHGLVFGDGYLYKKGDYCTIDLCGDSKQFSKLFVGFNWNIQESDDRIRIKYLPNYMKKFPDFDNINDSYKLGFIMGWFAADGHVSASGNAYLCSSNKKHMQIFNDYAPTIGVYTTEVSLLRDKSPFDGNVDQKLYRSYIIRDSLFEGFFIKENHINNYKKYISNKINTYKEKSGWRVVSIDDTDIEQQVWCVEEPITNTFTLEGGINTHNCTTVPLTADTLEAIARADYDLMKVAAYRQGVGIDVSNLRPRGSRVGNAAEESTGAIPWMDKLTRIGDYVGQLGRKPAMLVSLNVNHPDIEEFITCKDDLQQINNANISVQITNEFMEAVKNDDEWELRFEVSPHNEIISKKVSAKKLFHMIAEHAHDNAEPGVQYIDLMKEGSIVQAIADATGDNTYKIISTNACSEKPLAAYAICNLLSINMEMFPNDPEKYKAQLERIVPYLVRLADNVTEYELTYNLSPLKEQKDIVSKLREIGLGLTNIHGWLLKADLAYDSDEAADAIENFMKCYAYHAFKASIALGKEKGSAPAFDLVKDKTELMRSKFFRNIVDSFYSGDATKITHLRNCALMSIAPTGSLSSTFPIPCISSGIEPIIGAYYWRRTRAVDKGTYSHYFVIPNWVKNYILSKIENRDSDDYILLDKFPGSAQDEDGKIGLTLIDIINKYVPKGFFKPAHEINAIKKVNMMGRVYNWIDAAVSCTYNMDNKATVEDVEKIHMAAYDAGVRAVSVYRDGSREGILIFEDPVTNKARFDNKPGQLCEDKRPVKITPVCAPKRPKELACNIHHCSVKGTPWLVLVGLLDGIPYEIFAGESEEGLYIPKTCKEGIITKHRGGKYSLGVMIRRTEVEYKDVAHTLMNTEQRVITRMLSLSMRHGTPLEFIQEQLKKANGDITEFSTVVARVLGGYIKEYIYVKDDKVCPNCGQEAMVREESCSKCINCHYSKCG